MEASSEPKDQKGQKEKAAESERSKNVWRGTPRAWERCLLCNLKKKCSAAGVVRGSKACADARYSLMKR